MSQQHKLGTVATSVYEADGMRVIRYHRTEVVKFDQTTIILESGGWQTATTKTRMNQASSQFDLGFSVFQKDWSWFVSFKGKVLPFSDSMTLTR